MKQTGSLSPKSSPSTPRIGPPRPPDPSLPARQVRRLAQLVGDPLWEWQTYVLDVGLSVDETSGRWTHREVGLAVARQNGKTRVLFLRILLGLLLGERILHTAQNREIPRELFVEVAEVVEEYAADELKSVRRGAGQEIIRMRDGGSYRILAPRQDAVRGHTADLLILDEIREYRSDAMVSALQPTQRTSYLTGPPTGPQTWYASNAGDPDSVVLNRLRRRGLDGSPGLAWIEYSADPSLDPDDPTAWTQANPALAEGIPDDSIRHDLQTMPPERFETEVLCRWVAASGSRAIPADLWDAAEDPGLGPGGRPVVSIDADPDRNAVAVAAAWILSDGRVGTDLVYYAPTLVGAETEIRRVLDELEPVVVGFDPWTAATLAEATRRRVEPVTGRAWVAACSQLLDLLQGDRLRHPGRKALASQLAHAQRRTSSEGRWWITAGDEPVPGVTATARAVYLASRPRPVPSIT